MKNTPHMIVGAIALHALTVGAASAVVEIYKTEAEFLDRLDELGLSAPMMEGFESSAWDATRWPAMQDDVVSQGLTWSAASRDLFGGFGTAPHGMTTNANWALSGQWGLYENHSGEGYPTSIRISGRTMYAVGGWFNTNPDLQSVGFLFENRTTANAPGYVLAGFGAMYPGDNPAVGHVFSGVIDPEGFDSIVLSGTLEVNEKGRLEGGTIFGCDDFLIVSPTCDGDADGSGTVDFADLNIVLAGWGQGPTAGDVNGDGLTNFDDLNVVLGHWAESCP